jgi:hypothetical protein
MNETGLKLTCNSGNQELWALKGSKRIHTYTQKEKGGTLTLFGWISVNGSNWILPVDLYKGKYITV